MVLFPQRRRAFYFLESDTSSEGDAERRMFILSKGRKLKAESKHAIHVWLRTVIVGEGRARRMEMMQQQEGGEKRDTIRRRRHRRRDATPELNQGRRGKTDERGLS